jgi:LysM repeat protein
MARFSRGSSPLARHAAVLGVSLAAIVAPVGGGVLDLDLSQSSSRLLTLADLPGAVNNCFLGATQEDCPGLTLGWQPALPASTVEAAAPAEPQELVIASDEAAGEPEVAVEDWPTMEVRPGDTLFGLAIWFDVSPWDLAAFNGIDIDGLLIIGETLWIPVPAAEFVMPPEPALYVSAEPEAPVEETPGPIAAFAAVPAPTPAPTLPPFSGSQSDVIAAICSFAWDCEKMVRIAYCESGLNPNSFNPAGYYGLFQINYSFDGWNDPWTNARVAYEQKYLPALARGDALAPWPVCRYA